jgi:FkbM family methyltransferase
MRYRSHWRRQRAQKLFYQHLLQGKDAKLVFDIGANEGNKTALFSTLVEKVVSVEPSPGALDILKGRFFYNPKVVIVGKGIGMEEGIGKFHLFEDADCYNTLSSKWTESLAQSTICGRPVKTPRTIIDIPVTTLDQLIKEYGVPSYIKIDVEGYELSVIRGLTHRVASLSFECNLPEFTDESIQILSILTERWPSSQFNYCLEDPPTRFEAEKWLSCSEMSRIVNTGMWPYMEIYQIGC